MADSLREAALAYHRTPKPGKLEITATKPLVNQRDLTKGLSAGRVQSVALRLICEREREVEAFMLEEYWSFNVSLKKGKKTAFFA